MGQKWCVKESPAGFQVLDEHLERWRKMLLTKMWKTTRQAEGRWGRVRIRSLVWGEVWFEMPVKYII